MLINKENPLCLPANILKASCNDTNKEDIFIFNNDSFISTLIYRMNISSTLTYKIIPMNLREVLSILFGLKKPALLPIPTNNDQPKG